MVCSSQILVAHRHTLGHWALGMRMLSWEFAGVDFASSFAIRVINLEQVS